MAEEAEVDRGTAIDVFQWLREVCSTKLIHTRIILGGTVDAVQIKESRFLLRLLNTYIPLFRIHRGIEPPIWSSGCLGSIT